MVGFMWDSAHIGVEGNEGVDNLGKESNSEVKNIIHFPT